MRRSTLVRTNVKPPEEPSANASLIDEKLRKEEKSTTSELDRYAAEVPMDCG